MCCSPGCQTLGFGQMDRGALSYVMVTFKGALELMTNGHFCKVI